MMPVEALDVELVGHTGGSTFAVFVDGNRLYLGIGARLVVMDVSSPSSPTILGRSEPLPGTVRDIHVSEGHAYVTAEGAGLQIFNVYDASHLVPVGYQTTPGQAWGLTVAGDYAYVADGDAGLQIVNVSRPDAPFVAATHDTPGSAREVVVQGGHAYVADHAGGLRILNVGTPSAPTAAGALETPDMAYDVALDGNYAYVADYGGDLQIVDVSSPSAPYRATSLALPGNALGVALEGEHAYLTSEYEGVQVVDVADPLNPGAVGSCDTPGFANAVVVTGGYAYVADWTYTLQIIGVATPSAPHLAGSYRTMAEVSGLEFAGNYGYVAGGNSQMWVVDVSTPTEPIPVANLTTPGYDTGIVVSGTHAYLTQWSEGLQVVDIADPTAPALRGRYDTPGIARSLRVRGDHAYVANDDEGLWIINVANPSFPYHANHLATSGTAYVLDIEGNYAFVSGGSVVDISTPGGETIVADMGKGSSIGIDVTDGHAYLGRWQWGFHVMDVSDPLSAYDVASIGEGAYGVVVDGTYAYYIGDHGLRIADISDPAAPYVVGYYNLPTPRSIEVHNGYLYVGDIYGGLHVLRHRSNFIFHPTSHVIAVLAFDNNLDPHVEDVVEKFRQGTEGRADLQVTLLVDRFGADNTRVARVQGGAVAYETGIPWLGPDVSELDTAAPEELADFLTWARAQAPDDRTLVFLMGHGSWVSPQIEVPVEAEGEGAQMLGHAPFPVQPRGRDFTSGDVTSRTSLSTPELGDALRQATAGATQPFDLVFFDQCFTGSLDTLYEVRETAGYFVASPNYAWAAHAYDRYLARITPTTPTAGVAQAIVEEYQAELDAEHPNAIFWVAGASVEVIAEKLNALAGLLLTRLADDGFAAGVLDATLNSRFYDTTLGEGDLHLGPPDELVDLSSFAAALADRFPGDAALVAAVDDLHGALGELHAHNRSGAPWMAPYAHWELGDATLSVVAPLTPTLAQTPERVPLASLYRPPVTTRVTWLPDPTQQVTVTLEGYPAYLHDGSWDDFIAAWYARGGEFQPVAGTVPRLLPARFVANADPAPLTLDGNRAGTTSQLSWSATDLPDVARYALYVKWPQMNIATWLTVEPHDGPRTFTHSGLVPGDFVYFVTAQDADGYAIAVSHPLTLTVPAGVVHQVNGSAPALRAQREGAIPVYANVQDAVHHANPGDTIQIAAGTYYENLRLDARNYALTLEGGYDPVDWSRDPVAHPTIIDGGGGASCVDLVRTREVTLTGLHLTNAERLVRVYPAHDVLLEGNYLYDAVGTNYTSGIDVESNSDYHTHDVVIRNNVIRGIRGPGYRGGGIDVAHHQPYSVTHVHVLNNTIHDVSQDGILMGKWHPVAEAIIMNNIVSQARDTGVQIYDPSLATADYNAVHDSPQPYYGIAAPFTGGPHDLLTDPLFVDAGAGDLHLQPASPCIDAGDPTFPYNHEPQPNGGRINLGAYGNTREATPSGIVSLELQAQPGLSSIALEWTATNDPWVTAYRVYRRSGATAPLTHLITVSQTHYSDADPDLVAGTTYAYYVDAVRGEGSVAATSNVAEAPFGAMALFVPDVWAPPNRETVIPVSIRNAEGLALYGADIWLEYDPTLLEPVAVTHTVLTAGYNWQHVLYEPGLLHILLTDADQRRPIYGDGALFQLHARVLGDLGETGPLHLLPFGEPRTGGTGIYAGDDLDDPAQLILEDGTFHVDNHELGNLNSDEFVNVADAVLSLHISVGKLQPEPWQRYAGDPNYDSVCDAGDAAMIRYRALHLDWPQPEAAARRTTATSSRLRLGNVTGAPGETVEVPLYLEDPPSWAAIQISVAYDPAYVTEVVEVSPSAQATNLTLEYEDTPGLLQVAMANGENLSSGGEIATLRMRLQPWASEGALTPLKLAKGKVYDIAGRDFTASNHRQPVELADGSIQVLAGYRIYLPLALNPE
jgi:hypothetical protein